MIDSKAIGNGMRPWLLGFIPVVAWIAAQQISFMVSGSICASGHRWPLQAVIGAAFLVAAAAGILGWRDWRRLSRSRGTQDSIAARRRFMALGSVLLAGISLAAIVALAIPAIVHRPCD